MSYLLVIFDEIYMIFTVENCYFMIRRVISYFYANLAAVTDMYKKSETVQICFIYQKL